MTSYRTFRKIRRVAVERRQTEIEDSDDFLGMIMRDEREAAARSQRTYGTVARVYKRARRPVHYQRRQSARTDSQSDVEQPRSEVLQYPPNTLPDTNW